MSESRVTFADPWSKARYLAGLARLDGLTAVVQAAARPFTSIADPLARATAIHALCRDRVRYVRDPGGREQFADAGIALVRGFGDCDDKHRLLVALTTAAELLAPVGLDAFLVPVFPRDDLFAHVSAAYWWPDSYRSGLADAAGYVRAECILAGLPLGSGAEGGQRDAGGFIYS